MALGGGGGLQGCGNEVCAVGFEAGAEGEGRACGLGGAEHLGVTHMETPRDMEWATRTWRGVGSKNRTTTPSTTSTTRSTPTTGARYRGNDTTKGTPATPAAAERSDPTQHAKRRTGDCPEPRNETATRRNVTWGGGGALWKGVVGQASEGTSTGGTGHLGLTHTETQRGRLWTT